MCLTEPNLDSENIYQVLGVHSGATSKDICAAYKRLALRYHPDKNPDNRDKAEHAFKRITCAYETLRDPTKRQQYDSSRTPLHGGFCNVGSFKQGDDLYGKFFGGAVGGSSNINNIDIAGIFNFDCKPRKKPAKAPARPVHATHLMSTGATVVIHGLAKMPGYNGKSANIRKWDALKGRYEVLTDCASVLSLRPQNLTQLCHVTVAGHESQPELDGKRAEIVDFNEESGHYVLLLNDPPSVLELPPRNCIFPHGTAAILQGLSDDMLNGQMCSIAGVDHNTSRYLVELEGGRQLKVRFEKVMC